MAMRKSQMLTLKIPTEMHAALRQLAETEGAPVSVIVRKTFATLIERAKDGAPIIRAVL